MHRARVILYNAYDLLLMRKWPNQLSLLSYLSRTHRGVWQVAKITHGTHIHTHTLPFLDPSCKVDVLGVWAWLSTLTTLSYAQCTTIAQIHTVYRKRIWLELGFFEPPVWFTINVGHHRHNSLFKWLFLPQGKGMEVPSVSLPDLPGFLWPVV